MLCGPPHLLRVQTRVSACIWLQGKRTLDIVTMFLSRCRRAKPLVSTLHHSLSFLMPRPDMGAPCSAASSSLLDFHGFQRELLVAHRSSPSGRGAVLPTTTTATSGFSFRRSAHRCNRTQGEQCLEPGSVLVHMPATV